MRKKCFTMAAVSFATALAVFALIPLTALAGMWLSWLISCRVVAGKEF